MKLENDEPMIFAHGDFHPICGAGFWNNEHGINIFCKTLGYTSGVLTSTKRSLAVHVDAMRVGQCKSTDTNLTACSSNICNDMELGGACNNYVASKCMKGEMMRMKIKCNGGEGKLVSCKGILFCIFRGSS